MKSLWQANLELLDRYRYIRSNFFPAYHSSSYQHRKRDLGVMRRAGLVHLPERQKDSANYRYSPRVYELAPKALRELSHPKKWEGDHDFWHRLMVTDIVLSFEIACKQRGLRFRHRRDLIGLEPFSFDTDVKYTHPSGRHETYQGRLEPDDLFAIEDTYFVLEADRHNEPITRGHFNTSSYLRKLLQYRDVLKNGKYKHLFPNLIVLNITTSVEHAQNIMRFMDETLESYSQAMLFKGIPVLGSRDTYPEPLTHLLAEPFDRVGHEPFIIEKEVLWTRKSTD
jgi:hypothetical protein